MIKMLHIHAVLMRPRIPMNTTPFRLLIALFLLLGLSGLIAYQQPLVSANRLTDPFSVGWMLSDTNGDGVVDFIAGKVVVPARPSAGENAAAADIAARLGFGSTGLTAPVVIAASEDRGDGPRIYVGRAAVPARLASAAEEHAKTLQAGEGGIFAIEANLAVLGQDDAGLLAAAEAFAARAPFIWRVPGERLVGIAAAVDQSASGARAALTGVTYFKDKSGINRAFLEAAAPVSASALQTALNNNRLANVHELAVTANGATETAVSSRAMAAIPPAPAGGGAASPDGGAGGGGDAEGAGSARLDLATIYTMRGLFRGTPRMPIPSNLDGQLYVPRGPRRHRDGQPRRAHGPRDHRNHTAARNSLVRGSRSRRAYQIRGC